MSRISQTSVKKSICWKKKFLHTNWYHETTPKLASWKKKKTRKLFHRTSNFLTLFLQIRLAPIILDMEHCFKIFFALDLSLHIFRTILLHSFVIFPNEPKRNTRSFTLKPSCTKTITNCVYFSILPFFGNWKYKS